MTQEELIALAEKIKAGTATKEETLTYHKELNKILLEMKALLE
ncbi:MAG: hypothetical protein WCG45_01160 [bacterium]